MATGIEWQGRVGQEWADKADALDLLLGPVGQAGIAALGDTLGKRVLDLGCGAGRTSLDLAARGASVTGIDISEDLLTVARRRDENQSCRFVLGDAAQAPLGGSFDTIYSRCGAMFFDDPVGAWRHIRQEAGRACRFALVCWRAADLNGWASVPLLAARPVLGEELTRISTGSGPGPFAWAEPDIFAPILRQAGWQNVTWQEVDAPAEIGAGDDSDGLERAVVFCLRIGPLASRLRGINPQIRQKVASALRGVLRDYLQDNIVKLSTNAWIIQGDST